MYSFPGSLLPLEVVRHLRETLAQCACSSGEEAAVGFSSGCAGLDRLLPTKQLRGGMLIDWLAERRSNGAGLLALLCAREACRQGGVLIVVDRRRVFYPPAATGYGFDPRRLLVVHPRSHGDALWATIQSLRSTAVAAVWAHFDAIDSRAFRRLQLAAQAGRALGLFVRPATVRGQPTWADVQLLVASRGAHPTGQRRIDVRVLRSRRGRAGSSARLMMDNQTGNIEEVRRGDETYPRAVAAELVHSADSSRSA